VLILKEVEVLCFDTLLQVLILKEMQERRGTGEARVRKPRQTITQRRRGREGAAETPTPRVFLSKSAQVIETKGRESQKERQER
jgi:hypothetical protein